jgi:hypothetical protein
MVFICGCLNKECFATNDTCKDSYENPTIKLTKINPEISMEAPATSIEECSETSLVRKRTPIPNPNAERMASISPKVISVDGSGGVITVCMLSKTSMPISLTIEIKNPINARTIPVT